MSWSNAAINGILPAFLTCEGASWTISISLLGRTEATSKAIIKLMASEKDDIPCAAILCCDYLPLAFLSIQTARSCGQDHKAMFISVLLEFSVMPVTCCCSWNVYWLNDFATPLSPFSYSLNHFLVTWSRYAGKLCLLDKRGGSYVVLLLSDNPRRDLVLFLLCWRTVLFSPRNDWWSRLKVWGSLLFSHLSWALRFPTKKSDLKASSPL